MRLYASCSLLAASMKCDGNDKSGEETNKGAIEACVEWLMENEFITIQKDAQGKVTFAAVFYHPSYHDITVFKNRNLKLLLKKTSFRSYTT